MQNYVGQQIDRYRITERLGMGGMAVVYKAYDTRLEREVALKLIRTEPIPQDQHERLFKRFEREAKAQASFKHPHIVAVHDYGEVDNSPYLVMDFISGGTLKDRLNGPVDWRQAVGWLIPVAEALAYAHQRGIVHRDVKPANILFDEEGQPILTDFGIAKVLETDEATLTGTGLGVGTPEYMAPEQWQGKTSAATDQYALGVVLYELITGRKPYSADTPAAIILMQANEPLQAPSEIVSGIPESVEKALYKALARNPEDRYENMEEFALALRGLLAEADDAEPILREKETLKPGPVPVPQASGTSESVTRDALDATPVEELGPALQGKRGLPKWALWAGIGIISLVIVGLLISISGNLENMDKGAERPLTTTTSETLNTKLLTSTTEYNITATLVNEKTYPLNATNEQINPTITSTPLPEGYFVMPNLTGADFSDLFHFFNLNNVTYELEVVESDVAGNILSMTPKSGEIINNNSTIYLQITGITQGFYSSSWPSRYNFQVNEEEIYYVSFSKMSCESYICEDGGFDNCHYYLSDNCYYYYSINGQYNSSNIYYFTEVDQIEIVVGCSSIPNTENTCICRFEIKLMKLGG